MVDTNVVAILGTVDDDSFVEIAIHMVVNL